MTESGFEIDGRVYPVPDMASLTMGEAEILYGYARLTLDEFVPAHPEAPPEVKAAHQLEQLAKIRQPGFQRAMVHIAYQRGNPAATEDTCRAVSGSVNAADTIIAIYSAGDDDPPADSSRNEPDKPSSTSERSRLSGSGSRSSTVSGAPEETLAATGTGG